jgi:hypothetical protein
MTALTDFQAAAATFLTAAATYAADATAVAKVTQGGHNFYFDPTANTFQGSGTGTPADAVVVFAGDIADYAAAADAEQFLQLSGYNLQIGGGVPYKLEHD